MGKEFYRWQANQGEDHMYATLAKKLSIPALLSFNDGFLDTAGFVGLQGLFTAHVTGNFVTLGATLISGTHGVLAKVLALPEFIAVVALARVVGVALASRQMPALRVLVCAKVLLLLVFFGLAVTLGPFADSDAPSALLAGFAGIAAMALQNAIQRVHLSKLPPSTLMTGNTTQAVLDAVDLWRDVDPGEAAALRARFGRMLRSILWFAAGCAGAASLYRWTGFWSLAMPAVVGVATALTPGLEESS